MYIDKNPQKLTFFFLSFFLPHLFIFFLHLFLNLKDISFKNCPSQVSLRNHQLKHSDRQTDRMTNFVSKVSKGNHIFFYIFGDFSPFEKKILWSEKSFFLHLLSRNRPKKSLESKKISSFFFHI